MAESSNLTTGKKTEEELDDLDDEWNNDWKFLSDTRDVTNMVLYEDQISDHEYADTIVICNGGNIPVHRSVLCSSSSVLREILNQQDIEEYARVFLQEYKVDHVASILNLLYTGAMVFKGEDFGIMVDIIQRLNLQMGEPNLTNSEPVSVMEKAAVQRITFFKDDPEPDPCGNDLEAENTIPLMDSDSD